ncbi:4-hydroxybenzoate octaprenyltransferase [Parvularcula sp. ZS-1/3]|uniref:4-hydroxybenzoate octaprenyltransferase n=1 Tax=Parvularcula mediterranea TaxID=2732508 RepID=A0A7Y3W4S2_9PROT|nr:4-hydroxybenzoate octaprenyltransferase [Parvularcula mediterranea]NNU15516.1 4-hydroxybenzoate octaprenyltransferase [Parvularcula mediterranea]
MSVSEKTIDAEPGLVDRAPAAVRPYLRLMRVDRPIGVWLLFLPCLWGMMAARPEAMDAGRFWWLAVLFFIGSFVMRSAGCVWNDLVDRDLDRSVERTRNRPIASGVVSRKAGLALAVVLCLVGFLVLIQLGMAAILIGIASIALVAAYPFMKRITWWPQVWLGLTFNWGVLVGSAAVSGGVTLPAALLYAAGVFWTLGYDTIYALQDIEDDALAGIKSSARRLGGGVRWGVLVFYAIVIALASAALVFGGKGQWSPVLLPVAMHLTWQVASLDPEDARRNLMLFKSNIWPGAMMAAAMLPL